MIISRPLKLMQVNKDKPFYPLQHLFKVGILFTILRNLSLTMIGEPSFLFTAKIIMVSEEISEFSHFTFSFITS